MRHEGTPYAIVPPDPAGTVDSLSALGYSVEAAIADIVDNSIDAAANLIDVRFEWDGSDSYVAVSDNGVGMTGPELEAAMALALRGPSTDRAAAELGRFGMGLKTASFSQCKVLTVWSRSNSGAESIRTWDLDEVVRTGEWRLLTQAPEAPQAQLQQYIREIPSGSGTVVLWSGLTRIVGHDVDPDDSEARRHFNEVVARVEEHLGMTFSRFLKARGGLSALTIRVNGNPVVPWDPFMSAHPSTRPQPEQFLDLDGQTIRLRPYVLPPKSRLTDQEFATGAGPRGWLEQQGFYLYRNDRLIVAGSWLGLRRFRQDEKHLLARISLDIPSGLDQHWSIDVRKASGHPPIALREALGRAAKATREHARAALSARTKVTAIRKSDEFTYVWRPERRDGVLRLKINWRHPLVREATNGSNEAREQVKALLRFMEETVPIAALRIMFEPDSDEDYTPFAEAPGELADMALRLYEASISWGLSPSAARARLRNTPPFDEYPDLVNQVGK